MPGHDPSPTRFELAESDRVAWLTLWLAVASTLIRAHLIGFDLRSLRSAHETAKAVASGGYDVLYCGVLGALAWCLAWRLARSPRAAQVVYRSFVALATLSLIAGLINVRAVEMLGQPLNLPWFYYADFLGSAELATALVGELGSWRGLGLVVACLGFPWATHVAATRLLSSQRARRAMFAVCALGAAYVPCAIGYLRAEHWPHAKVANPVWAFLSSVVGAASAPRLFTMPTGVDPAEFAPPSTPAALPPAGSARARNVVIVVLESVPAEYLTAYGGVHPVTPELSRHAAQAARFDAIYAPAPATNKAMLSLLCSVYPWVSYRTISAEYPRIALPCLASELGGRGWVSGFFSSAGLEYQNARTFLEHRGFDRVEGPGERARHNRDFTSKWSFLDGTDDLSTADSLLDWVDQQHAPFLAVMWTMMTHYPYFTLGDDVHYVDDPDFNRYLNALRVGDAAFGRVMEGLRLRGLREDTLVVVVGDHGEAFGQHDQRGHGVWIYDENVRVPLLLIQPGRFTGQLEHVVGSTVDIAPTILELLGLPAAARWQGRSLYGSGRAGRAYSFAPWSDHVFAVRDQELKLIFNATQSRYQLFDLARDPHERTDLSDERPQDVQRLAAQIGAWVQYQTRMYDTLLQP